jgi:hypothetical protein
MYLTKLYIIISLMMIISCFLRNQNWCVNFFYLFMLYCVHNNYDNSRISTRICQKIRAFLACIMDLKVFASCLYQSRSLPVRSFCWCCSWCSLARSFSLSHSLRLSIHEQAGRHAASTPHQAPAQHCTEQSPLLPSLIRHFLYFTLNYIT